jgi:hypothetical protein
MIEGYAGRWSVEAGSEITLHVSTDAPAFSLEIARVGATREVVWRQDEIPGARHVVPEDVCERGCGWPPALTLPVREDWRSGFYLVTFTTRQADRPAESAEAFFVVRAARPTAPILLVLSTNTWNAYNSYGGANTYAGKLEGGIRKASFARPLALGQLSKPEPVMRLATVGAPDETLPFVAWAQKRGLCIWSGSAGWFNWERPFVHWAEAEGYTLDYAINADLEGVPGLLDGYRLMLSAGHDEYWSWGMRDAVEAFIAGGGNLCILSGNTCFWQVRYEDGGQTMVAYKSAYREDPVFGTDQQHTLSGMWSNRFVGRPETALTGLTFAYGGYARIGGATPRGMGGYLVYRPKHWVFEGTGLRYGDLFGADHVIVGYETDGCPFNIVDGLPYPKSGYGVPDGFEILGLAPAALWSHELAPPGVYPPGKPSDLETVAEQMTGSLAPEVVARFAHGHAVMGIYRAGALGGTVFNGGTTDWTYGLAGGDSLVERVTRNLMDRLSR